MVLICLTPLFSFAEIDEENIKKTIEMSVETRKTIGQNDKERTPANAQLNNWQDFENAMKSDKNWDSDIDNVIKEFK